MDLVWQVHTHMGTALAVAIVGVLDVYLRGLTAVELNRLVELRIGKDIPLPINTLYVLIEIHYK